MTSATATPVDPLADFGKGIFDEPPAPEVVNEAKPESKPLQLSDRLIAIAQGRDPDEAGQQNLSQETNNTPAPNQRQSSSSQDEESTGPKWTAAERLLASELGISDEDLDSLGTSEALAKTASIIRSRETKEPKEPSGESGDGDTGEEAEGSFPKLDLKKYEDSEIPFDDEVIEMAKSLRATQDLVEKLTKQLEAKTAEPNPQTPETQQQVLNTFHDALDKFPAVFGESLRGGQPVQLNDNHRKAREQVRDAAATIEAGYIAQGKNPPPLTTILEMAVNQTYGKQLRERAESLRRQSATRRPTGNRPTNNVRESATQDTDDASAILNQPEVAEFLRQTREGTR